MAPTTRLTTDRPHKPGETLMLGTRRRHKVRIVGERGPQLSKSRCVVPADLRYVIGPCERSLDVPGH